MSSDKRVEYTYAQINFSRQNLTIECDFSTVTDVKEIKIFSTRFLHRVKGFIHQEDSFINF